MPTRRAEQVFAGIRTVYVPSSFLFNLYSIPMHNRYGFSLQNRFVKLYDSKLSNAERYEVPSLSLQYLHLLIFSRQGWVLSLG
jgi:hypothetical protein